MIKRVLVASLSFLSVSVALAQEYGGMWIPTEVNEKEMKSMGMKISAQDIFNTQKPSIKDAVVQFNGGCTAEIISPQGLLLTNHHCGYGQIQAHSSVENDLLTNGFWAKTLSDELPNPGVTVDFITDIKDATTDILDGTEQLSGVELKKKIQQNIENYINSTTKGKDYKVSVESMYYGNKYYAFTIETFKDIRLVGAPPSSIGKFGLDTDNWVWPRHSGDFSLFRIYADKNNKPAEYSKDNVPFVPQYYLPISIKEKNEDDFTFVIGFPGSTQEYLPSIAVEKIMNEIDPAMINVREIALKILDEKMRTDIATRIKYASKYARISNYWKKWKGEVEGLNKSNALNKKRQYEASLIKKNPAIKNTLDLLNKAYTEQAPYALNSAYFNELIRNSETLNLANIYLIFLNKFVSGKITTEDSNRLKTKLASLYKNYDADLDAKVTAKILSYYVQKTPAQFLPEGFGQFKNENNALNQITAWTTNSFIAGKEFLNDGALNKNFDELLNNPKALADKLKNDPYILLLNSLSLSYYETTYKQLDRYQNEIDALQKKYMAEQMNTDKDRKFYPDANSTLRVTYGKVKGSNPRDAVYYHYRSHLGGIMEKYIPNDYEFDVPSKLIQLYRTKDYGMYADKNGEVPVNFTATNHTTGGNSGSPVLDADGNLIGLNFDRQWEGTMSDINFDPRFSRNIMVDTKYILFIIDKFANAQRLLKEIKIVK